MVEAWIEQYGYLAIALGTFFEGESILLIGGALAHRGLLSLPWVVFAAFAGGVLGDQTWFRVGRIFGTAFLERHPSLRTHHARAQALLRRFGDGFVLGFRFVLGIRTITPLLLGTTSYRSTRFLALNVCGCTLWAAAIGFAGYSLGAGLAQVLERAGKLEELALGALALIVLTYLAVRRFWLRR